MDRIGRQTPTVSHVLPYQSTKGQEAVDLYNTTGRTCFEWQEIQLCDILATDSDGLYTHTVYGYSVPRRNGKNEVVAARELWGLLHGEHILHTAHRTTTSSSASRRLVSLLNDAGWEEVQRPKKDEAYSLHYTYTKQLGLEKVALLDGSGGECSFRTRTAKGGLGEGFDLLVIDEAQEYTDDQESSLKYVVSDSKNPQTILCGTPPTAVSTGTVFVKLRTAILTGKRQNAGWAEWSVEYKTDVHDVDAWYECNPSMGLILTERKVADEITNDDVDFNIQRLGLWLACNQASEISEVQWQELQATAPPKYSGSLFVGIKYGKDGRNVALSIARRTEDGKIFVETVQCRSVAHGNTWLVNWLVSHDYAKAVVDGTAKQDLLAEDLKRADRKKRLILPKVVEVVEANTVFERELLAKRICHGGQAGLKNVITNCQRRAIGTNGGFGYKSMRDDADICVMDSAILALWACATTDEAPKQRKRISY